jgi:AcrR family transcriptional regulator
MPTKRNAETAEPRGRKRPGPSGSPDIREGILDVAELLFATRGFAATSMREIAERVDVTPAMIHYYFGSKGRLLQAVMERALEPMAGAVAEIEQRGEAPLRDLTQRLFALAAEHPYLPQLITREVFLPGGQLQEDFLQHFAPRLGGRLPGILRREQREGRVDAGLNPEIAALLMLSLCFFPFVARPAAEAVLGIQYDEAGLRSLSRHVTSFLERGLRS